MKTVLTIMCVLVSTSCFASQLQWPDTVATKQDVQNLMAVYPERTKAFLDRVLKESSWLVEKTLAVDDLGVTSDTQKVIETTDETTKEVTRLQMILSQNSDHLNRLKLTREDATCLADTGKDCIEEVTK